MLTTESGRVFWGVNAGPREEEMLEGFLGSRNNRASLKSSGGLWPSEERRSFIKAKNNGREIIYSFLYAKKGIPLGPGEDEGHESNTSST